MDGVGKIAPGRSMTVAELDEILARISFPERRVEIHTPIGTMPKQAFRLAITSSMDSYKEGIQSGWEMDNRAGNPKTSLGANGAVVDVLTSAKSRAIRHFNRMTEDVIEIRIQLSYAINFDGSVLELCDTDDTHPLIANITRAAIIIATANTNTLRIKNLRLRCSRKRFLLIISRRSF